MKRSKGSISEPPHFSLSMVSKCRTSQASRSIRIAWLLEELGLDYKLHTWDRESSGLAPAEFKQFCETHLEKAPRAQRRALDSSREQRNH